MYYVVKKYIFLQKTYTLKLPCEKKGIGRGLAELENSKCPDNAPENFMAAKQTGNCSARKRVLEGACGTGKQQVPGQCPGEFHGCKADRKLLREKKGIGRELAELE